MERFILPSMYALDQSSYSKRIFMVSDVYKHAQLPLLIEAAACAICIVGSPTSVQKLHSVSGSSRKGSQVLENQVL